MKNKWEYQGDVDVITRYTRKEMGALWAPESRFKYMLEVEIAVAQAQAQFGIIPKKAYLDIKKKSKYKLSEIENIEKITKHDVIAFVSNVASYVGESGRYIHFGMTSSDVLDTALSLQIREAFDVLVETVDGLLAATLKLSEKHQKTLMAGRTHGMHAEPTTFGYKMLGHFFEFKRCKERILAAKNQMNICKLSGAVGTYSSQDEKVEQKVADLLKLERESVATQVVPRDRHAQAILALSQLGSSLERLAVDLRHMQRTELGEVIEGFTPGQKGSSAMPHKKNPISAENITGQARLLRSYALVALENIALWHERDISHSSTERVMFPDAFILADYATHRMAELLKGLYVDKQRLKDNMDLSHGMLMSSHVLLALVDKGLSREDAYKIVQRVSHGLKPGQNLQSALLKDSECKQYLKSTDLKKIFSGQRHIQSIEKRFKGLKKEMRY